VLESLIRPAAHAARKPQRAAWPEIREMSPGWLSSFVLGAAVINVIRRYERLSYDPKRTTQENAL